jgi:hypothetical protein
MAYCCRLYGFISSWVNLIIPDISGLSNLSRMVFLDTKTGLARYSVEGRYHRGLKEMSGLFPVGCPGPGVAGVTWLLYLQAKTQ